MKVFMED